jgi:sigma-B regulation protein RsbU (phosphoserine phosphatase)
VGAPVADEDARAAAARRYDILEAPPDGTLDRITTLAARLLGVPVALVAIADTHHTWLVSRHGVDAERVDGLGPGTFGMPFYAATTLTTNDGHDVGSLCVLGPGERTLTDDERDLLDNLACLVVDALQARVNARDQLREAERLATALQASLLPPRPPSLPGMDLATRYEAASGLVVGGDFYDVFRVGANDWAIAVGDACGHGARAAALTGLARWTIRSAVVHHAEPSRALAELNTAMLAANDPDDDTAYCSAVLARLELDVCGAWVTLCCAGHPRPIVVRKAGWVDVRGQSGSLVGLFEDPDLDDDRVGLGPGDAVAFFTDGLTEARGADGEMFGEEALPALLLAYAGRPAAELADAVMAAARAYAPGPASDDRALVVVRVPDDAKEDSIRRVSEATGISPADLVAPRYPVGEAPARRRPQPPREARIKVDGTPSAVPGVRAFLRRVLASWRMDELSANGDVELMVTELTTNAVRHGLSPVTVIARYDGERVRVEVGDGSRELPAPRTADPVDEGGRGIQLVEALSAAWGTLPTLDGKRVWFEVPVPPA